MQTNLKVRVYRNFTENSDDLEGRTKLHLERATLLHGLADSLTLNVQDWGETDLKYPREVVEIIVALGSAGVFTAMVSAFKSWLEKGKLKEIEIEAKGTIIKMKGATKDDITSVIKTLELKS